MLNKAVRVLIITNGLILFAGALLGPIYAFFVKEIGGGILETSLTIGVFGLAAALTTYLTGLYVDRIKRPAMIVVVGYIVMGVGFFLYIFVESLWMLFLVQIVIGFAEAFYSPAIDTLI
ncbi:MFS transporter, partial [Patescibacteria group bacterium]|nr:MFS transporter [Patescibacteria group bacterium]